MYGGRDVRFERFEYERRDKGPSMQATENSQLVRGKVTIVRISSKTQTPGRSLLNISDTWKARFDFICKEIVNEGNERGSSRRLIKVLAVTSSTTSWRGVAETPPKNRGRGKRS